MKFLMMIFSTVDKAYHNKIRFKPKLFQSLRHTYIVIEPSCLYCVILLIEEILHQLIGSVSYYQRVLYYPGMYKTL